MSISNLITRISSMGTGYRAILILFAAAIFYLCNLTLELSADETLRIFPPVMAVAVTLLSIAAYYLLISGLDTDSKLPGEFQLSLKRGPFIGGLLFVMFVLLVISNKEQDYLAEYIIGSIPVFLASSLATRIVRLGSFDLSERLHGKNDFRGFLLRLLATAISALLFWVIQSPVNDWSIISLQLSIAFSFMTASRSLLPLAIFGDAMLYFDFNIIVIIAAETIILFAVIVALAHWRVNRRKSVAEAPAG